ncbi:MAG: hypothetical protein DRN37_01985 [Thermoplasmata archaeon]|nr:MAG: hypothetical protein DRN37_01985 [Thermoplasmata archaeon]
MLISIMLLYPEVTGMEGFPECRACNDGVLVPFYSPEGHVVYFCNNCRARFSAYYEEPMIDGVPVFSEIASYFMGSETGMEEPLRGGMLMEKFRSVLDEMPPGAETGETGVCPICSGPLGPDGRCLNLCFLPEI